MPFYLLCVTNKMKRFGFKSECVTPILTHSVVIIIAVYNNFIQLLKSFIFKVLKHKEPV